MMKSILITILFFSCVQAQKFDKNDKKMIKSSNAILLLLKEKKGIDTCYLTNYYLKKLPKEFTADKIKKSNKILTLFAMPNENKIVIKHINNEEGAIVKYIFDNKLDSSQKYKKIYNASIEFTFFDKYSTDKIMDFNLEFNSEPGTPLTPLME